MVTVGSLDGSSDRAGPGPAMVMGRGGVGRDEGRVMPQGGEGLVRDGGYGGRQGRAVLQAIEVRAEMPAPGGSVG